MASAGHSESMKMIDQENLGLTVPQTSLNARQRSASPSQKTASSGLNRKAKEKGTVTNVCLWIVDHQISLALSIISTLFFIHIFFPEMRHHTVKFFRISYYQPSTGRFALGWDDIFFVFYWIIVVTGTRCAALEYVLTPLAAKLGIEKKKARVRFAEQAWILLYYSGSCYTGIYIAAHSDYWFNLRALWQNWPTREMDGLFKWYYLVQFAFWLQQIVVVNIEERRKDHWQMFSHHIITCALIFLSYGYHFYRVGNVILCLMDVVDWVFALAKILKYLELRTACDVMFGVFMTSWLVLRNVSYMWICYSIVVHIPQEVNYGCYRGGDQNLTGPFPSPTSWAQYLEPFRDPTGEVCFTNGIRGVFLGLLYALQILMLVWFVLILRVAYRVLSGQGADDVRSDDEEEDEEEEIEDVKQSLQQQQQQQAYTPQKMKASGITPIQSPSSRKREYESHSSAVNLPKELLGRIGCDKGVNND